MKSQNIGRMLRYYRKANGFSVKYVVEALEHDYNFRIYVTIQQSLNNYSAGETGTS